MQEGTTRLGLKSIIFSVSWIRGGERVIVTALTVTQGERVQADTAALAIAGSDRLVAILGVEPEDLPGLHVGMPVEIHSVFASDTGASSRLSGIHAMINPKTGLVDVLAPIPEKNAERFIIGAYLTADLLLDTHTGIVVPRSAVLRSGENGLVRLEDIAHVYPARTPQWLRVTADGRDAVLVQVYQQPGGNTVQIVKNIQQRLHDYHDKIPAGIHIANWYDQSRLITESASSVRDAILIGVALAAVVLLIFLRSLKITLVAVLVVPSVLASTVLLLHVLHMSFNIMTLGGMAAAVGLIVDDAIVMIEQIIRRLREQKQAVGPAVRQAAIEFTRPLTGSSAATIIIFAPLAFLSGVTGAFFKALSLTMASSLMISFFLAWLAIPLIAEHLLHRRDAEKEDTGAVFRRLEATYRRTMARFLKTPALLALGVLPLIALGFVSFKQVGSGFMPHMDEGGFVLDYRAPAGTSLTETDRLLREVETILQQSSPVETYSRRTGTQLGGGLTEANEGDFFVRLRPFPRPPIDRVRDRFGPRHATAQGMV